MVGLHFTVRINVIMVIKWHNLNFILTIANCRYVTASLVLDRSCNLISIHVYGIIYQFI